MSFFELFGNMSGSDTCFPDEAECRPEELSCSPEECIPMPEDDECGPDYGCNPEYEECFPDHGYDCRPEGALCNPADFL